MNSAILNLFLAKLGKSTNSPLVELAYPVITDDIVLSVLHLQFTPRHFLNELQENYLEFLRRMEDLIKPMLVFASQLDRTETLQAIVELVHSSTDVDAVIDRGLSLIVKRLGFEFATSSLVDELQGQIKCIRG